MLFLFGVNSSAVESYPVQVKNCPNCNHDVAYKVEVKGNYFHIFFVPIFPLWKSTAAVCQNCGNQLKPKTYFPELQKSIYQHQLINKSKRRPWWHGLGCLVLIIAPILLLSTGLLAGLLSDDPVEDERLELLEEDILDMDSFVDKDENLVTYDLKNCLDTYFLSNVPEHEVIYHTRIMDEKILVLIKAPDVLELEIKNRKPFVEQVRNCINSCTSKSLKKFIYILGSDKEGIISTPYKKDDFYVSNEVDEILNFYNDETIFRLAIVNENETYKKADKKTSAPAVQKVDEIPEAMNSLDNIKNKFPSGFSDSGLLMYILRNSQANPSKLNRPNSFRIKECIDLSSFPFDSSLTRYNYVTNGKKLLIIVRIPDIQNMKREERYNLLDKIETCLVNMKLKTFKEYYIAVDGHTDIVALKTPYAIYSDGVDADEELLLPFFD